VTIEKRDPWSSLARHTAARIALGRAGGSMRTDPLLDFRLAHARAKDAVELPLDSAALEAELARAGFETVRLASEALDRRSFLLRPDLGRTLDAASRTLLTLRARHSTAPDLCIVVSDGLSALAAERQATPLLVALAPLLAARSVTTHPVLVVPYARVKIADEIGEILGARHSLVLLGERPGLSSPDSLGAYLTHRPRAACTDADRNCVSNIRPQGMPAKEAAQHLAELIFASTQHGLSGVALRLNT